MPIPTKKPSSIPRAETGTTSRAVSSRRTKPSHDNDDSQNSSDKSRDSSVTSNGTSPNTTQSRLLPRPTARTTSSTLRHTRTASTNTTTIKPTSSSTATSSQQNVTPSTVSRPAGGSQQHSAAGSTRLRPMTGHSRTGSTSSTATNRGPTPQAIPKPRPTSNLQPPSIPLRTRQETGSIGLPRTTPTNSIKSEPSSTSSRLQDELYQLQLLHQNSPRTLSQYKQSIQSTLTNKKKSLRKQEDHILALEASNQEAVSTRALGEWLDQSAQRGSSTDQIQLLSSVIAELDNFKEDSDALAPLQQFETWLADALATREERASYATNTTTTTTTGSQLKFVQSLGHVWTAQIRNLERILSSIVQSLHDLGESHHEEEGSSPSGIGVVLSRLRQYAGTLLQEVETAVAIERTIMKQEAAWEAEELEVALRQLGSIGDVVSGSGSITGAYMGVWS